MSAIWKGTFKGLKKLEPQVYDVLVGAVCSENHWTLVVSDIQFIPMTNNAMFPKEKRCLYLDPFGAKPEGIQKCIDITRAFMRQRGIHQSRWSGATLPHPVQNDMTSCGVIVCKVSNFACSLFYMAIMIELDELSNSLLL
ncbi:hypothetical protein N1851_018923 [Merluccius polli]|uniref:Ubiquitin-like protease family profile domain-containing protein n=1 Tax=Merluccius polli TaxID=89951 RepID=A0AA47NXY3_MERPO|nr:hypothetical protein N1851_018923 [Merluccius polli]